MCASPDNPPTDASKSTPDAASEPDLLPVIYDELRRLAGRYLRDRPGVRTLQPTAVVHEAYLKLLDRGTVAPETRTHFFAVAAQAMRWVVADYARERNAQKRGGGRHRVTLSAADGAGGPGDDEVDLAALDEALRRLGERDARAARVVELRYLSGLTIEETAAALDISIGTVKNEWRWARAWLMGELGGEGGGASGEGPSS
ncbi:MAG: ECF-type sigma factor [Phycisphaerales bacterium]